MLTNEEKIKQIEVNIKEIMNILGIDVTEGNFETPKRVAKMYVNEIFDSLHKEEPENIKVFSSEGVSSEVTVTVPFSSVCEHHWLPFFGEAKITYKPRKKVLGLSKFARIVKFVAKKPQLQERLTKEIADLVFKYTEPEYVKVEVEAEHTCVRCRGVEVPCNTKTEYVNRMKIGVVNNGAI